MMIPLLRTFAVVGVALAPTLLPESTPELVAQTPGTIQGQITDSESGRPLATALVGAVDESGRQVGSAVTGSEGRYSITAVPGTYTMTVSALGYGTQTGPVVPVAEGTTVDASFTVAQRAYELSPLVVSVGRTYERAIGAPAHVEVVSEREIRARPTTTPVDHLRSVPGVDVITHGVQSTNVVARGFNNIFSGALHTLTDNRIAGVPSLRVNVMSFVPTTNDDLERMEVVLGPSAALYGPNTANGVLHMITKSPLQDQGSSLSAMGGERSVWGGAFRTSHLLSDNLGIKVSGQYMRADEWRYEDPTEQAERLKFETDLEFWRADLMRALEISQAEADRRIARIGARDFDIERWSGEARMDWAITEDATAIFTAGTSNAASQIELTGLGAGQVNDWRYTFYQARLNWDRLFAQVYLNQSNAGDTFLLPNGAPIVDRSKLWVAQLQHQSTLGSRQRLIYGVDLLHTDPETEGTINGIYEDEDDTQEIGVYLQSETQLSSRVNLVLTGRMDDHSALPSPVFSPRAALVFEPSDGQAFRLTYNRAFSTPSSLNQFLDLPTAIPNEQLARLGYSVRVQGTGTDGFRIRQADGSYMMRSPFTPGAAGGPAQLVPAAGAATYWPAAVQVVATQAAQTGQPLPQNLVDYLLTLQPGPGDIGANYLNTVTGEVGSLGSLDLPDLAPIRESTQSTFEIGYKGILAERTLLAADVWYSRRENLVTPLTVQTPLVTMDGSQIASYLVPRLQQINMSPEQAMETAARLAQFMAQVPVGVVSSQDVNANGAQLLTTYVNVDEKIDLWGVDLAAEHLLTDEWSIRGSLSFVNDHHFETDGGMMVALNAPKEKGSIALNYRREDGGLSTELRTRFSGEFPASSGVYEGLACLDGAPADTRPCVDSYVLVDLNVSYRLPGFPGMTAQLAVQNVLDEGYRSFPGVPEVGRMALLQLRYEF